MNTGVSIEYPGCSLARGNSMSTSKKDKVKKGKGDQKSNEGNAGDDKKKEGPTSGKPNSPDRKCRRQRRV